MRYNDANFLRTVIGMPMAHSYAFMEVASYLRCAILVRATGPTCHGLLEEGYDTKGYRIHGKSCDWGPMAGFVMRDPRLNKYGLLKENFNRQKHAEALVHDNEGQGWLASTIPLKISHERVEWLRANLHINTVHHGRHQDGTINRNGIRFDYTIFRENDGLYSVCFNHRDHPDLWKQETGAPRVYHWWDKNFEPMLAMTNPPGHCGLPHGSSDHLKAITGDYDLFAVWPYVEHHDATVHGDDHRPLGTVRGSNTIADRQNVEHLERNFTQGGQGTKLGNITNRIYHVCQRINSMLGRQVLWHSDESARPFLDDVDLPVIAFNPAYSHFGIETIDDLKLYIANCEANHIQVSVSDAWAQAPTQAKPNRLGTNHQRFVPADGVRIIVPDWYNS